MNTAFRTLTVLLAALSVATQSQAQAESLTSGKQVARADAFEDGLAAYKQGDYHTAYQVFRSLAEQGDARGQNGLGNMYVTGQGVAKDDVEAVRWYRMAAKQGHAQAQHSLGVMYEKDSAKRSRVELRGGYWNPSGSSMANTGGLVRQSVENVMGSIAYIYQLNANLALMARWAGLIAEVEQNVGILGISQDVVLVTPLLFGVRYYWPLRPSPFRPYVVASAGPYFLQDSQQDASVRLAQEVGVQATMGTYAGGGVDFALGRYFMLGAGVGYHLIANFAEPIRNRKNFSGPELSISLSVLWGKDVGEVNSIRR